MKEDFMCRRNESGGCSLAPSLRDVCEKIFIMSIEMDIIKSTGRKEKQRRLSSQVLADVNIGWPKLEKLLDGGILRIVDEGESPPLEIRCLC